MSYWDFDRFGEDIKRTVQDAIDSQNYERLNETIADTVRTAADSFTRGIKNVGETVDKTVKKAADMQNERVKPNNPIYKGPQRNLFAKATGAKVKGILLSVFGCLSAGTFGVLALIVAVSGFLVGEIVNIGAVLISLLVLTTVSALLAGAGAKRLGVTSRFKAYKRALAGREFCNISELAQLVKKPNKFVARDVGRMIRKGWFLEGHLDQQNTCLIVSHDCYEQYLKLMQDTQQRKLEEEESARRAAERKRQREMEEQAVQEGLPREVREILKTGDTYIAKIHACNDAIPGAEISAKISRMEMIVDKIFDRVEQNPDSVPDIRRMMEYYLPTTVKLLDAYIQLEAQPVQGENILTSKREIEGTLDTLNVAFEKLLDSLFQDTAWDVSSDISVLRTILAQEGLSKEDFKQ